MKPRKAEQSIFAEAWRNMSADMEKFLPKKMRGGKAKWQFAVALALFELVVLGVVGKLIYDWWTG
jgi:hypothetical protein